MKNIFLLFAIPAGLLMLGCGNDEVPAPEAGAAATQSGASAVTPDSNVPQAPAAPVPQMLVPAPQAWTAKGPLLEVQPKASATPNDFKAVTEQLDAGGDLFMYWNADQAVRELKGGVDLVEAQLDKMVEIERRNGNRWSAEEFEAMRAVARFARSVVDEGGLADVKGVGMSSLALEKDLFRNRMYLLRDAEREPGAIWKILEGDPGTVATGLSFAPATTVMAHYTRADIGLALNWVKQGLIKSGVPMEIVQEVFEPLGGLKRTDYQEAFFGKPLTDEARVMVGRWSLNNNAADDAKVEVLYTEDGRFVLHVKRSVPNGPQVEFVEHGYWKLEDGIVISAIAKVDVIKGERNMFPPNWTILKRFRIGNIEKDAFSIEIMEPIQLNRQRGFPMPPGGPTDAEEEDMEEEEVFPEEDLDPEESFPREVRPRKLPPPFPPAPKKDREAPPLFKKAPPAHAPFKKARTALPPAKKLRPEPFIEDGLRNAPGPDVGEDGGIEFEPPRPKTGVKYGWINAEGGIDFEPPRPKIRYSHKRIAAFTSPHMAKYNGADAIKPGELPAGVIPEGDLGPLDEFLKEYGGELGVFLTLDTENSLPFKQGPLTLKLPRPGIVLVAKKSPEATPLADHVAEFGDMVKRQVIEGQPVFTFQIPKEELPIRMPLEPTLFQMGSHVVLVSDLALVKQVMAVYTGKAPGLRGTAEFARLSGGMKLEGQQLQFVSQRAGATAALLKQLLPVMMVKAEMPKEAQDFLKSMTDQLLPEGSASGHIAVLRLDDKGLLFEGRASGQGYRAAVGQSALVPITMALSAALGGQQEEANEPKANFPREPRQQIRELTLGLKLHLEDKGVLQDITKWADTILPEVGQKGLYRLPGAAAGTTSYTLNAGLRNINVVDIKPDTVLIFQASGPWNQTGGLAEAKKAAAAGGGIWVGFGNGDVRQVPVERLERLNWGK
ncbi:MAG TPA: hypothetical protein DGP39_09945 [Verrucomicrobiales bacterium]|nr:hypothetical protein [Verrucomicrobiales bacterium]